jgi:hypothetical protein
MTTTQNTKGLYSRREIGRMTTSALDELLCYYQDTGNAEGAWRVEEELDARELEADLPAHDDTYSLQDMGIELGSYAS